MALLKKIETESGVEVGYHNVTLTKDTVGGTLTVYVNSYTSQKARDEGKPPAVTGDSYTVPKELWRAEDAGGIEAAAYAYLKTLPEFEGAEDELSKPHKETAPDKEE